MPETEKQRVDPTRPGATAPDPKLAQSMKPDADVRTGGGERPEPSKRMQRRMERLARKKSSTETKRVRVIPRDEDMRRVLKHINGTKFSATGSAEWPLDQFTKRRLREGAIRLEDEGETQRRREQRGEEVRKE